MKFMNNHYGESRVFGHARFKTMPEEVETGGGAFSGESEKDSSAEEGPEVELSTDELVQQLAAERANSAKLKANLDKTLKEKGEITKNIVLLYRQMNKKQSQKRGRRSKRC